MYIYIHIERYIYVYIYIDIYYPLGRPESFGDLMRGDILHILDLE